MKFGTFSIVIGSNRCNATCPYCISKRTRKTDHTLNGNIEKDTFSMERLHIASSLAVSSGVTTCLLTGTGEPLLSPDDITIVLEHLNRKFPIVELQTNGIELQSSPLDKWRELGLTTISLSCIHWKTEENQKIFGPYYISLKKNINILKEHGFSIRFSYIGLKGYIGSLTDILDIVQFSKTMEVDQTTWRPVYGGGDFNLDKLEIAYIKEELLKDFHHLLTLPHGAMVFDIDGINFCLSNCLTRTENPEEVRQIILFSNGRIGYDWDRPGAVIL